MVVLTPDGQKQLTSRMKSLKELMAIDEKRSPAKGEFVLVNGQLVPESLFSKTEIAPDAEYEIVRMPSGG
jgi:sulfur carrier protein ThiS